MENEGFNTQKNSGLNLNTPTATTNWASHYFLLQDRPPSVAVGREGESAAAAAAQEQGKRTAVELFGSLKNMGAADVGESALPTLVGRGIRSAAAGAIQIRLDSS